jgi:hypothetical protein
MTIVPATVGVPAFALAATALLGLSTPIAAANDLADSLRVLEQLERARVTIDVHETPIDQVLAELAAAAGVSLRVDWQALEGLTVDADDRISFTVRDVPADAALAALLSSIGLPGEHPLHDVGSGQVVVTTIDRMAALRRTDVYDLRPLLGDRVAETALAAVLAQRDRLETVAPSPHADAPVGAPTGPSPNGTPTAESPKPRPPADPAADPAAAPSPLGDVATPATGDRSEPAPQPRSNAARLVALILDHVDPEAWLTAGGLRGRIDEYEESVVVTATPRTHRQVRAVLAELSALRPAVMALDVALVEIDRTLLELVRRRHEPGSAALARAILAAETATIPWRGGGPTSFGETLRLESRSGDLRIVATILARRLGADGRASLEVDARLLEGTAGERKAQTTAAVELRDSALLIDLGDSGPTATLLIVLATSAR